MKVSLPSVIQVKEEVRLASTVMVMKTPTPLHLKLHCAVKLTPPAATREGGRKLVKRWEGARVKHPIKWSPVYPTPHTRLLLGTQTP